MSTVFFSFALVVFLFFVAPLWLWLHYRGKRDQGKEMNSQECEQMRALAQRAEALHTRVQSLERILDEETPDWRQR